MFIIEIIREFFEIIAELMARPPGRIMNALTPWIIIVVGGSILALMVYAVWATYAS